MTPKLPPINEMPPKKLEQMRLVLLVARHGASRALELLPAETSYNPPTSQLIPKNEPGFARPARV